jgi:hypothetical protein
MACLAEEHDVTNVAETDIKSTSRSLPSGPKDRTEITISLEPPRKPPLTLLIKAQRALNHVATAAAAHRVKSTDAVCFLINVHPFSDVVSGCRQPRALRPSTNSSAKS